jgi:hypothetical protein
MIDYSNVRPFVPADTDQYANRAPAHAAYSDSIAVDDGHVGVT